MIKIEKLLQELCPNGVDFLRIEEICNIYPWTSDV